MRALTTLALLAGTLTAGLMAGLFAGFAYAVMPGLRRGDDRTFVTAMRRINEAILNGWFLGCFMGAPVVIALATALQWAGDGGAALPFTVAGLVLYLVMFAVTAAVNVPLNERLAAAGEPDGEAGLAAVRERFESSWAAWNTVRAVAATAAFGCLAWALVLYGRATA
ncbi:DUF1772 domain-containing protein [Streptomyces radiopugnans]|uniref:Uncharacterized membrane protein n=1 Tax=Streptomyces radiopugnans TaxID=403935 RepID=A0A1H9EQD6_9ACTN|nr:anthrone oxygenase family protein [Streptomyces radiopugnans]SEQ27807.1 Uncharacterized membrane protein [Streptomyces radiopugnans]